MGHSNVWNSHPKNYGPGSRAWYVYFCLFRYVNRTHSIEALRGYSISLFVRFITHVLFFFFFLKKIAIRYLYVYTFGLCIICFNMANSQLFMRVWTFNFKNLCIDFLIHYSSSSQFT